MCITASLIEPFIVWEKIKKTKEKEVFNPNEFVSSNLIRFGKLLLAISVYRNSSNC